MFKLTRYFALTSLAAMVIAALAVGFVYRLVATQELIVTGEHHTVDQTRAFVNALGNQFMPLVARSAELDTAALRADPVTVHLNAAVRHLARGLTVIKVKIYSPQMRTVYSSDAAQIGEDASANEAVRGALAGKVVSELVYRDRFNAFDGVIERTDVLQSYVPVTDPHTGRVEAVFELYENVTEFVARIRRTQFQVVAGVLAVFAALYAAQWLIVRRADAILHNQAEALRRQADEMRRARDAAETANRAKASFLANMSHELRTPLNGIVAMTDLALLDEALGSDTRDALETARQSSRALVRAIEKVLAYAELDAGRVTLAVRAFGPVELVERLAVRHRAAAADKGLVLESVVGAGLAPTVLGDATRIEQALGQLLENAIEFTEHGRIELSAAPAPPLDGATALAFAVRDTGVGIDPARQDAIFEAFAQGDASTTRRHGGTGLGLTIASQLATLMGGRVRCDSVPGQGSMFTLTLPLPAVDPHESGCDVAPTRPPATR